MAFDRRATLSFSTLGGLLRLIEKLVLSLGILRFGLATLPTVSPIAYEELEAVRVDLHARLEADAKISEVHLIFLGVRQKEGKVACDCKE